QKATAGATDRLAACWYSSTSLSINVNIIDGQTHDLELYFLDWDSTTRSELVQISDATSGKLLDTESVSSFHGGLYLDWQVGGNVVIKITRVSGANAVLSGLFFDPAPTSSDVLSISSPTTYTAGTAQNITVTATSPGSGTDTQYAGTVHFSSSDVQA